jgi:hypothetical protein
VDDCEIDQWMMRVNEALGRPLGQHAEVSTVQPTVNEKTAAVDALRELQQESQRLGLYDEPLTKEP